MCIEGVEEYRERMESLDSFLTSPVLGSGSKNRLRFSGTEAVTLL